VVSVAAARKSSHLRQIAQHTSVQGLVHSTHRLPRSLALPSLSSLPLSPGVIEGMLGMTLFNIGLIYGFTSLGDQSGLLLPAAFLETPTVFVF
jgi:hypothetical protein